MLGEDSYASLPEILLGVIPADLGLRFIPSFCCCSCRFSLMGACVAKCGANFPYRIFSILPVMGLKIASYLTELPGA